MIWKQEFTLEGLNNFSQNTLVEHLGIEITEHTEDSLTGRMSVDHRTVQPMRVLHGGASAALAETLGSVASVLCIEDPTRHTAVGIELNASHLRSARKGFVYGTAKAIRIGRRVHVWQIDIRDEAAKLVCVSRLTMAIVEIKS